MIEQRLRARLKNIIVVFHPRLLRKRMRVEYVVSRSFRYSDVLRNGFHLGVAGAEEFIDRIWNLIPKPTQYAANGESVQLYASRQKSKGVRTTNIISGACRPQKLP